MQKIENKRIIWITAAFIILACAPLVVKNNYYITLLNQLTINMIVVFGLNFVTGLTGQMNLGTAGIYAIGAYISAILSRTYGISPWLTMLIAICAGFFDWPGAWISELKTAGTISFVDDAGFHRNCAYFCNESDRAYRRYSGTEKHSTFLYWANCSGYKCEIFLFCPGGCNYYVSHFCPYRLFQMGAGVPGGS